MGHTSKSFSSSSGDAPLETTKSAIPKWLTPKSHSTPKWVGLVSRDMDYLRSGGFSLTRSHVLVLKKNLFRGLSLPQVRDLKPPDPGTPSDGGSGCASQLEARSPIQAAKGNLVAFFFPGTCVAEMWTLSRTLEPWREGRNHPKRIAP